MAKKMDEYTRESLWQIWTRSDYVEKNYPEVAKAYKKGWIADFADFIHKKYPQLEEELVYNSPYEGKLAGCDKKSKKKKKSGIKKKGSLGDFRRISGKITENEMLKDVAKDCGISKEAAKRVMDAYWSNLMARIYSNWTVTIPKVGSFCKTKRSYSDNLNKTGKRTVDSVKFTMTQTFKNECLGKEKK